MPESCEGRKRYARPRRNIDLQSVRPAELDSVELGQRVLKNPLGTQAKRLCSRTLAKAWLTAVIDRRYS
jgi:hypothetical protein